MTLPPMNYLALPRTANSSDTSGVIIYSTVDRLFVMLDGTKNLYIRDIGSVRESTITTLLVGTVIHIHTKKDMTNSAEDE